MPTKAEIANPYICDETLCINFNTALENGVNEVQARDICQRAMKRYISVDPVKISRSMREGIECGLYLADCNGEFATVEDKPVA